MSVVDAWMVAGALAGGFAIVSALPRRRTGGGQLARLMFPSWRFFDRDEPHLELFAKSAGAGLDEPWQRVPIESLPLPWSSRGILAQLLTDIDGIDDEERTSQLSYCVTYRIVGRIAAEYLNLDHVAFRVTAISHDGGAEVDVLTTTSFRRQ